MIALLTISLCVIPPVVGFLIATRKTGFVDKTGRLIHAGDVMFGIAEGVDGLYMWHGVVEEKNGYLVSCGTAPLSKTAQTGKVVGNLYRAPLAFRPGTNITHLPKSEHLLR